MHICCHLPRDCMCMYAAICPEIVESFDLFVITIMTSGWNPFVQILSRSVLRNYTWQRFHIFKADQSYMKPVHCQVLLIFNLENMTFTLKIVFGPLLRNYKWLLLHIFRAFQWPVHCVVIWLFDLLRNYKWLLLHIFRAFQWPVHCVVIWPFD